MDKTEQWRELNMLSGNLEESYAPAAPESAPVNSKERKKMLAFGRFSASKDTVEAGLSVICLAKGAGKEFRPLSQVLSRHGGRTGSMPRCQTIT